MSLDTVTRINDYFDSAVALPNNLYTIHADKNEAIQDDMGGDVWARVSTEASFDDLTGEPSTVDGEKCYTERGLVIVEVFCAKGLGTLNLYGIDKVVSILRDAFRNYKLLPTGSEEGVILFEDISAPKSFEQPSRGGTAYFRKDVFINYQKNYSK